MTNSGALPPPPDDGNSVALCDWIECTMLVVGRTRLSRTRLRKLMRDVYLGESDEEWDSVIDLVLLEVERRRRICGGRYPFEAFGTGMRGAHGDGVVYVFQLLLSVSPNFRRAKSYQVPDRLFDLVALEALKSYLGPGSEGVRFAFPSADDRPRGFRPALVWLRKKLRLGPGTGYERPHVKDAGVDVVAWKPMPDGRPGFVTILGQCTVELGWHDKGRDIVTDRWKGYVDFGKTPLTALAVPFAAGEGFDRWDEIRRTVWLFLDRVRTSALVDGVAVPALGEIEQWVEGELEALREVA